MSCEIDFEQMTRALRAWFEPGEVFEIRILEALTKQWNSREHTEAGYFDYEHIEEVPRQLSNLLAYKGIYVTVNPLNPAVLGRAANRFKRDKLIGAKDEEVARRRWLLIDCDAKRVSGVPSSEEEHAHALAKAEEIRAGLASMGWPEPICLDSGNGAQLMFRIDLPAQDDGLVKRCLESLSACSDADVEIDQTVFNPARIWRLPGAWNCKGDECPEQNRIHRPARILSVPEPLVCVSAAHLTALADSGQRAADSTQSDGERDGTQETDFNGSDGTNTSSASAVNCQLSAVRSLRRQLPAPFSIDAFVAQHFPAAKAEAYNGGRKWVLDVCPFNADHNNRSAVITQAADGRLGFRCHHNGCLGKDWHALRALLEPKNALPAPVGNVDTSAFLDSLTTRQKGVGERSNELLAEEPPTEPKEWELVTLKTLEAEVLKGTILARMTNLLSRVTIPALPLPFTLPKALALIGTALSGRNLDIDLESGKQGVELARFAIDTAGGQVCNMYCMLAAPSGTGKDIGGLDEKMARRNGWFIGTAGSKEGLYDAYMLKPNGLLKISELQPYLEPKHWQHEAAQFFTEAFNAGAFTHCQSMRTKNPVQRHSDYCYPNVLANIQPDVFGRIVRPIDIETGLLGRFLISRATYFSSDPGRFNLSETLDDLQDLLDLFRKKRGLLAVPECYAKPLKEVLMEDAPEFMYSHIARLCNEYYPRLAVILSVTENATTQGDEVILTPEAWERAKKLVYWFYQNAFHLFGRISEDDDRVRRRESILNRVLCRARKVNTPLGFTRRDISLGGLKGTDAKERREALDELVERGWLAFDGRIYRLTPSAPKEEC